MLRTLAIVAALSAPAIAETRIDVGPPHGERPTPKPRGGGSVTFGKITKGTHLDAVSVELRGLRATAHLRLSSTVKDGQDAALELEVPSGTQVTYLGLTIGGDRRIAHFESSAAAREEYERIVEGDVDPALIEMLGTNGTTDKLRLRVFPLTRGKPAKVEVIMTLPPSESIVIDPGRHRVANLPRAKRLSLGLSDAEPAELDRVDGERSLFIAEPFLNGAALELAQRREAVRRQQERGERPRGAIRIAAECLDNPLAPSCM
jgi:hypothetical protein